MYRLGTLLGEMRARGRPVATTASDSLYATSQRAVDDVSWEARVARCAPRVGHRKSRKGQEREVDRAIKAERVRMLSVNGNDKGGRRGEMG